MSNRRIVVEHPDGRRLTIPEDDYTNPDANPLNHEHDAHEWNSDRNETVLVHYPARVMDDWKSLKQEGFKPYAYLHGARCDRSCTHDTNVDVHEGHEIKLKQ
jgi:hypothetical protein